VSLPRSQSRGVLPALALTLLVPASLTANVIIVTSSGDTIAVGDGCTLREAITAANTNAVSGDCPAGAVGSDTINFAIPGTGVHTIQPASPLPTITEPVILNGYSQPGSSKNTLANGDNAILLIEIDGTNAGPGADGFSIGTPGNTIQGFVINRFVSTLGLGGGGFSVRASNNTIAGNFIGVNASGTAAVGNGGSGVALSGSGNNTIGGTAPGARNVISSNSRGAIVLIGTLGNLTTGNLIQGNFVGTNASGVAAIPNDGGITITFSSGNTIGGTAPGARNLISGNFSHGIAIVNASSNNVVQGNLIGTDVTGTLPLPNGALSLVTLSSFGGVFLSDGSFGASSHNAIGGTTTGAGNIIAFNTGKGVTIGPTQMFPMFPSLGNAILDNSIFSNSGLGIDLNDGGVTANDTDDSDSGPNGLQNFPVITAVMPGVGFTTIQGTLNSTPNTSFLLQFFSNASCDPSGNGEGQTFLGTATPANAVTDGTGNATFTVTVPTVVTPGRVITSTATDVGPPLLVNGTRPAAPRGVPTVSPGSTSEFSACFTVQGVPVAGTPTPSATSTFTPTVVTGGGSPAGNIPTLSGGMLALLALALAAVGFFLTRRT
jgi:CSLREA domain-containing protein